MLFSEVVFRLFVVRLYFSYTGFGIVFIVGNPIVWACYFSMFPGWSCARVFTWVWMGLSMVYLYLEF